MPQPHLSYTKYLSLVYSFFLPVSLPLSFFIFLSFSLSLSHSRFLSILVSPFFFLTISFIIIIGSAENLSKLPGHYDAHRDFSNPATGGGAATSAATVASGQSASSSSSPPEPDCDITSIQWPRFFGEVRPYSPHTLRILFCILFSSYRDIVSIIVLSYYIIYQCHHVGVIPSSNDHSNILIPFTYHSHTILIPFTYHNHTI